MTTIHEIKSEETGLDPALAPSDEDMKTTLGSSFPVLESALAALHDIHPGIGPEWRFSPRAGWYELWMLNERRLFYVVPGHGGFRINIIVGDKALATLAAGPFAGHIDALLKTAKRTPEGTGFTFTPDRLDPALLIAIIEAKLIT